MDLEITPDVAHALGHYVYAYLDPRDDPPSIFYIGKGVGQRAVDHLYDTIDSQKVERIRAIHACNLKPRIDIIAHGLRDDVEASRVEAALIELVGIHALTSKVRGLKATEFPRRPLEAFIAELRAEPVEVIEPALLIRVNQQFRYGMSHQSLYEATRGVWVIGEERRSYAQLAMAVFAGIVREVYSIESWHEAGTTQYQTRDQHELFSTSDGRWEFVGHVAEDSLRTRYLGKSVAGYLKKGFRSPIIGINLG
jgi:hypothetical protein